MEQRDEVMDSCFFCGEIKNCELVFLKGRVALTCGKNCPHTARNFKFIKRPIDLSNLGYEPVITDLEGFGLATDDEE